MKCCFYLIWETVSHHDHDIDAQHEMPLEEYFACTKKRAFFSHGLDRFMEGQDISGSRDNLARGRFAGIK